MQRGCHFTFPPSIYEKDSTSSLAFTVINNNDFHAWFIFSDKMPHCSPDWPGTYCMTEVTQIHGNISVLDAWVLELQTWLTPEGFDWKKVFILEIFNILTTVLICTFLTINSRDVFSGISHFIYLLWMDTLKKHYLG